MLQVAMNVEAQAIDVPTGVQDYRPALYGGVSAVELGVDGIRRVALPVRAGTRAAARARLHRRHAQLGHQQLGSHQAPHRRRPRRPAAVRTDSRYRGRDAPRARARRLARRRPPRRGGMGEPQAPRPRRHDAGHRRDARRGARRRRARRQGVRRRRRRLPVLHWRPTHARRSARRSPAAGVQRARLSMVGRDDRVCASRAA